MAVLVNPTAGRGKAAAAAAALQAELANAGRPAQLVTGRDAEDAVGQTRQALADGASALVAVGGDGTAHLALQAVAGTGLPYALLPAGTGNDLAACLGFPADPAAVARIVLGGRTRPVDAVRTDTGRWWACVLGAGFDSAVNDRANRMRYPRGRRRYDVAMLAELRTLRPLEFAITLDGVEHQTEAMLVAVGNAPTYGAGMRVCPDADPSDGLLDVVVVGPLPRVAFLRVFPSVYRGTHVTHPAVTVHRARAVGLRAAGVTAYADGERLGPLPLRSTTVPGALAVLT